MKDVINIIERNREKSAACTIVISQYIEDNYIFRNMKVVKGRAIKVFETLI